MSLHFFPLKISQIIKETADCVSIQFEVPLEHQSTFAFSQGQSVALRHTINGEELRRNYSICAAPYEGLLKIAVKKVEGGLFSTFANDELQVGDILDVMPPVGKFFTALKAEQRKNYLAIAAGSGITPIISIIKQTLHSEPDSSFTLIFGNKNRSSIIFFEELQALKNKFLGRFNLLHTLTKEKTDAAVHYGRIDQEKFKQLKQLFSFSQFHEAFICGPEEIIVATKDFLMKEGLSASHIHYELFGTVQKKKERQPSATASTEGKSSISIIVDGRSTDFLLGYNEGNILDKALQLGVDLPFACKGGVCCTCKCKLLEGTVEMEVNWGLEHDEIAQGYVLSCQAFPTSEKVVLDFDIK